MLASQTPVVAEPTATPKPVPPLDRQLKTAQSISEPLIRDAAYLDIVLQAIILRDYWTAIRVAEATSTTGTQARGLKFVLSVPLRIGSTGMQKKQPIGSMRPITTIRPEEKS